MGTDLRREAGSKSKSKREIIMSHRACRNVSSNEAQPGRQQLPFLPCPLFSDIHRHQPQRSYHEAILRRYCSAFRLVKESP